MSNLNKNITGSVIIGIITGLILITALSVSAAGADIYLEGEKIQFDITPENINKKTMLPLDEIKNILSLQYFSFSDNRFSIYYRDSYYILALNEKQVKTPERYYHLNRAPLEVNDHLLVPLEFFTDIMKINLNLGPSVDRPEPIPGNEDKISVKLFLEKDTFSQNETIKLNLVVKNNSHRTRNLTFKSGQIYDFIVKHPRGDTVKKWSDNRFFTQALKKLKLEPGESIPYEDEMKVFNLKPGVYYISGKVMTENPITSEPKKIHIKK